ncbi:hypothetical protein [Streptomyces sp. NPDC015131]|uniref:hypothetical protein n=1 Tax=Streptomyces sp. NPDC015131 TaxID=3364941 RepID=UPI0036F6AD2D
MPYDTGTGTDTGRRYVSNSAPSPGEVFSREGHEGHNAVKMRKAALLAAVVAAVSVLSSCSGGTTEERKYAIPDALCGVAVEPSLLTPFLPPGEKVSTREESPSGGTQRCSVLVDGQVALTATRIWWREGDSVSDVAAVHAKVEPGEAVDGGKYLFSGTGAVGRTAGCADATHPEQALFTVLQVFAPDRDDEPAMKRLMPAYTKAVERSKDCRPGGAA